MNIHIDCEWKISIDGPPENPLQSLTSAIGSSPKDFSENKFDAYLYAICMGWDDDAYKILKRQHGWSDEIIEYQKRLHRNYIKAWGLLNSNGIK